MTITPFVILKIVGVIVVTFVLYHYLGMPWGLLAGCGIAMIVLP